MLCDIAFGYVALGDITLSECLGIGKYPSASAVHSVVLARLGVAHTELPIGVAALDHFVSWLLLTTLPRGCF